MKTHLIISLFVALCGVSFLFPQAEAAEKKTPATHMWIHTGNGMAFIYVNSVQHCEMLTKQAADINSSQANCYNKNKLVRSIKCQKKPGGGASCS